MSFIKPGPNAGAAPDCLQRPLRARFRQQVSASVRVCREKPAECCRVSVPDSEGPAHHTGPASGAGVGHGVGAALTGAGAGRVGSPASGLVLGADALRTRGRPHRRRREGEVSTAPAGAATSGRHGNTVRGTREALPLAWRWMTRSHGAPQGYARDARVQGVGPLQRTEEACAQRSPPGPAEQVEGRERAKGSVAESPRSRTQRRGRLSHALSRVRQAPAGAYTSTRGRSPVRECRTPGSVRGGRVTGIPTATFPFALSLAAC
jgi:hypothetical protein